MSVLPLPLDPAVPEVTSSDDAPELPDGRIAHLPGRGSMFYREVVGPPDAPVVVLLHGLGANADLNWHAAFEPLGRHFRVIAPDHRGHGRGIRSHAAFTLEDCADDVVALADHLGVERFTLAGYSMGGPIAQLAWRRHPGRAQGLVLCATSRDFRGHPRERLLFGGLGMLSGLPHVEALRLAAHGAEWVAEHVMGSHPHAAWAVEELRRADVAVVMQAALAVGRFTSRAWVHEVDVPAAVIVTEQDRLVPPHRQRKLAQSIAGSVVFEIHGDHHVVAAEGEDVDGFVHALVGASRAVSPWPETAGPRTRFQRHRRRTDRAVRFHGSTAAGVAHPAAG